MPLYVTVLFLGSGEPVDVTTIDTRGSLRTAGTRTRCAAEVSQKQPSRHTYDMITPTGQPSLFDQMKVHSLWASSSSGSTSASRG